MVIWRLFVLSNALLISISTSISLPVRAVSEARHSLLLPVASNLTLPQLPPGIPPPVPYLMSLPFFNVAVNFTRYRTSWDRDETAVRDIFRKVRVAATDPRLQHRAMTYKIWNWASGYMRMMITPERHTNDRPLLTWGLLAHALTGIDQFSQTYPELDLWFEILVPDRSLDRRRLWSSIGIGSVWYVGPRTAEYPMEGQ